MLAEKIKAMMQTYILIGFLFSLYNNFDDILDKELSIFYKIWTIFIVTFLFPVPLLIKILELHPKTEAMLDELALMIEDLMG